MINRQKYIWMMRGLVALVLAWNLQAALVFLFRAEQVAPSFELSGAAGAAAVQGVAVLFMMWNVPYFFAVWNPEKYQLALKIAVLMQSIGLIGELYIFSTLAVTHIVLRQSIMRFVLFDLAGLLLLLIAWKMLIHQAQKNI